MVNVPSDFKNLKAKVDDLDIDKSKTVLLSLIYVVSKEVVKKAKYKMNPWIFIKFQMCLLNLHK